MHMPREFKKSLALTATTPEPEEGMEAGGELGGGGWVTGGEDATFVAAGLIVTPIASQ